MTLSVRLDSPEALALLEEIKKTFGEGSSEYRKVIASALNKAGEQIRSEAWTILEERYALKNDMQKRVFKIRRASVRNIRVAISATYRPMTLGWWRAGRGEINQIDRRNTPNYGAIVRILKDGGAKVVKGAFWGTTRKGQRLIFRRKGFLNSGIEPLYGPSPLSYMANQARLLHLERKAEEIVISALSDTEALNKVFKRLLKKSKSDRA